MTLTKAGGGAFGIDAISLAQLYSDQIDDVSIVFTGLLPNASTVTQTFSFLAHPGRPTLASYIFDPSFDNVVSVSWDQGSDDLHQFDDIFVHATPEPGSFVLLASGLIAMAGASFKRRRSV